MERRQRKCPSATLSTFHLLLKQYSEKNEKERFQHELSAKEQEWSTNRETYNKVLKECQEKFKVEMGKMATQAKDIERYKAVQKELEQMLDNKETSLKQNQDIVKILKEKIVNLHNNYETTLSQLHEKKAAILTTVEELAKAQKAIEQQFTAIKASKPPKKMEDEKRRSQILLEQENKIIRLQEQLQKVEKARALDLAKILELSGRVKESAAAAEDLKNKVAELTEHEKTAKKTAEELYEIKTNLVTTNEEFKKLKVQLHTIREEKNALETRCNTLLADLNSVTNIVKIKEAALEVSFTITIIQQKTTRKLDDAEKNFKEELQKSDLQWKAKLEKVSVGPRINFATSDKDIQEHIETLERENEEKQKSILQLQTVIKDTKAIMGKWQKEIDTKSHEADLLHENLHRNKVQIAYLSEQNRLLLDCNKTNLNRLKSLSLRFSPHETSENEKPSRQSNEYKHDVERLKRQEQELNKKLAEHERQAENLLRNNVALKEQLLVYEKQLELLKGQFAELKGNAEKVEKISKELTMLPEMKLIYEAKMKGKDPVQQIACAIDNFLKMIRVNFSLFKVNREAIVYHSIIRSLVGNNQSDIFCCQILHIDIIEYLYQQYLKSQMVRLGIKKGIDKVYDVTEPPGQDQVYTLVRSCQRN
eukprot:TRINITY_DN135287_c0_g1_i1.p1 TRINITY_DN135287_c0_g1~~TRINITY_DN135287_c0_g1_i1.p1  ORF type:complete len:649 (-),score=103.93 TRINITY_DN135287_c0_g1_i1:505-2451(-)